MYALVLWSKDKTVSVVKDSELIDLKEVGSKTKVLYGDKAYQATILRKSDDPVCLNSCHVTTDGNVTMKGKEQAMKSSTAAKKKFVNTIKKQLVSQKNATVKSLDGQVMNMHDLFGKNEHENNEEPSINYDKKQGTQAHPSTSKNLIYYNEQQHLKNEKMNMRKKVIHREEKQISMDDGSSDSENEEIFQDFAQEPVVDTTLKEKQKKRGRKHKKNIETAEEDQNQTNFAQMTEINSERKKRQTLKIKNSKMLDEHQRINLFESNDSSSSDITLEEFAKHIDARWKARQKKKGVIPISRNESKVQTDHNDSDSAHSEHCVVKTNNLTKNDGDKKDSVRRRREKEIKKRQQHDSSDSDSHVSDSSHCDGQKRHDNASKNKKKKLGSRNEKKREEESTVEEEIHKNETAGQYVNRYFQYDGDAKTADEMSLRNSNDHEHFGSNDKKMRNKPSPKEITNDRIKRKTETAVYEEPERFEMKRQKKSVAQTTYDEGTQFDKDEMDDGSLFQSANGGDDQGYRHNDTNPLVLCREKREGKVRLRKDYDVWIDKTDLDCIKRWKNKPAEMVRRLLLALVGRENLKNMNALGGTRRDVFPPRQRIPKDIFACVEEYAIKHCSWSLSPYDYTRVINVLCSTLRNPKKNQTDINAKRRLEEEQTRKERREQVMAEVAVTRKREKRMHARHTKTGKNESKKESDDYASE